MTPELRLAGPTDADLVASIHAQAFVHDPVMSWVFREPGRSRKLEAVWGFLAREALVPLGATFLLGHSSCAAWTPPGSPAWPSERAARFQALLDDACTPEDVRRLGVLDETLGAHHPDEPVWYLGSIATLPDAHGRGYGRRLIEATLAVVDGDGLPAYLEATSLRSAPLYERHGFRPVEPIELPRGPTLVAMQRRPPPACAQRPSA